jgi:rod shape-determining protein MreD
MTVSRRRRRFQVALVLVGLVAAHFYLRPRLWDGRAAPDFLLLALMLLAIRSRPGTAAAAGFAVGLVTDVLTPARFGAGALAHTLVGYPAAWGRAVFFPDNLLVNAGVFALGTWLRNFIVMLMSGPRAGELVSTMLIWSPIQALSTAAAGVVIVLLFRDWMAIRLDE